QRQNEVGYGDAIDLVAVGLYSVTHFAPVIDLALAMHRMRALDEQVGERIGDQLESLVRKRHLPALVELFAELEHDESIGNARMVQVVEAERVLAVLERVDDVENGVTAHVGGAFEIRLVVGRPLEAQLCPETPVGLEVLIELHVDGADDPMRVSPL